MTEEDKMPRPAAISDKLIFIVNPIAGTHHSRDYAHAIRRYFNDEQCVILISEYSGHAFKLAKEKVEEGYRRIVAVGGDGTVNEVASALLGTEAVLGILPVGSGNGLARHLGIPVHLKDCLPVLKDHRIRRIDAGVVNDRYFFSTCGTGFDAKVGKEFASQGNRGIRTYVRATIQEYVRYRPKKYILTINGKKIKLDAFLINFANAGQYGYNAYIAPNARLNDGKLDLCILRPFPKASTLSLGLRLFFKNIDQSPYLEMMRVKKAGLKRKGNKKIILHVDGEPVTFNKKLKISVMHKAVQVMVPVKGYKRKGLLNKRLLKKKNDLSTPDPDIENAAKMFQ